jgi:fused signal recognition particle receptor
MNNKFDNNTSEKNQPIWENLKKLKKQLLTAFSDDKFDNETLIELEDVLIMADTGPKAAKEIISNLSKQVSENSKSARLHLANIINQRLNRLCPNEPILIKKNQLTVFLLVGVNGSGKTTTIGKLAHYFKKNGSKVALAACDTFRAAAKDQLNVWGEENCVTVFSTEGNDPSSVAFEAVTSSIKQNIDILLVDTAGRLPSKKNLIEELKKLNRVLTKALSESPLYNWLILDSNTGQNALNQISQFREALNINGLILTKFDGINKAGFLLALSDLDNLPVMFVGTGESIEDLSMFDAKKVGNNILGIAD